MKLFNSLFSFAFIIATATIQPALASDAAKEKRWADQIVDAILVGEPVWLEASDQKFLSIYTEDATGDARGAVIVIHGIGVHPNWNDVIYPLRTGLPDHGWATLSIQMPILANDADATEYAPLIKEACPRIQAAASFLNDKGAESVYLVAHSLGATMAAACLAESDSLPVIGFVAIGMSSTDIDPMLNSISYLEKIQTPMLDLYGSRDLDQVKDTSQARRKAARVAGNDNYRQVEIAGADHFFVGLEDELIRRVRGWLEHTDKLQNP